jgi:hypothetical protein
MKSSEFYESSERGAPFLRLETARGARAMPYATLLGIETASDGKTLVLDFAGVTVTVKGIRLHEIFRAIASGTCIALLARAEGSGLIQGPGEVPVITDIRIKEAEERD